MPTRKFRRVFVALLLPVSLVLLLWGMCAAPKLTRELELSPSKMQPPTGTGSLPLTPHPPAVPEQRLVTLEWPGRLRIGDADIIHLTLGVDEHDNAPLVESNPGSEINTEPASLSNVYDTHNVMAEARLDIAGLDVTPPDMFSQTLRPGETVTFTWRVRASEAGYYRGTVWLFLHFLPLGGGADSQVALSAQVIELQTVNLLGFGGSAARVMGLVGATAVGVFAADDLIKGIGAVIKRLHLRN